MAALNAVDSRLLKFPQLALSLERPQADAFICLSSSIFPVIRSNEVNAGRSSPSDFTLPAHAVDFLAASLELPKPIIILCWAAFGDLVATASTPGEIDSGAFGVGNGETLEPPTHCTTDGCHNALLTKRREYAATLFTLRRGILPITIVSLYCHHCQSTYHHNYKVANASNPHAQREYYGGVPDRIMVSMHHVVERELANLWEVQMVFSHASAEAASRIYNSALRTQTAESEPLLQPSTVWDSFFLHALLRDLSKRDLTLSVPHNGFNTDRLNTALEMRNTWMVGTGQELWAHACTGCQKIVGHGRISACVTDGVTVGHACCGVHDCQVPLTSQQAWFCPSHNNLRFICAVTGCNKTCDTGWRTCSDPSHRAFEENRRAQGKAMFMLRARQARLSGQPEPVAPVSNMDYLDHGPPEDNDDSEGSAPGPVKVRGRLSRRWTHNEQLMVRCCGIIISRATFFGSEAITSVKDFIHVSFPDHFPGSLPPYLFFDNNCLLLRHLTASGNPRDLRLAVVGFPVDVFHAGRKHKETDTFCTMNCSPVTFPELVDGDTWVFNSSAAEQANRWFGRFQPIVKEMPVLRYNFFLDEMIRMRNEWLVGNLRAEGKKPHLIPVEELETRL
ncbi:hypothetical protein B0H16DRAFT_1612272 [Mycena metata]|uniref:CxC5 like cysteine cluster associated with KDZ domain-containing protein n=1 Tax=Mycena metata TaxID=1033252 RepID=A0AAD7MGY0_9AGAR|nr:hypothetical protein B0H16DRAFT_1612272 [Mycena metata]